MTLSRHWYPGGTFTQGCSPAEGCCVFIFVFDIWKELIPGLRDINVGFHLKFYSRELSPVFHLIEELLRVPWSYPTTFCDKLSNWRGIYTTSKKNRKFVTSTWIRLYVSNVDSHWQLTYVTRDYNILPLMVSGRNNSDFGCTKLNWEVLSLSFFILISLPREQHCLQDLVFASLLRVMSRSELPRRVISQTLSHSRETMHRQVRGDPWTGTCICWALMQAKYPDLFW